MEMEALKGWPPAEGSTIVSEMSTSPEEAHHNCIDFYVTNGFVVGIIIIFGLFGNGLTVAVFRRGQAESSTMYLISNLAIVDSLVILGFCIIVLPPEAASIGAIYVAYGSNAAYTFNQMSIFFITIVVWQRYISVCKPHAVKTWCSKQVLKGMTYGAVTLSVAMYCPGFFMFTLVRMPSGGFVALPTSLGNSKTFYILHTVLTLNLISYFIPMAILIFSTLGLIRSVRTSKTAKATATFNTSAKAKADLTLSLIVVVIVFIICQAFRPTRYILIWLFNPYSEAIACGGPLEYFAPMTPMATIINSSVNFIIFVLCAKGFRQRVVNILHWRKSKNLVGISTSSCGTATDKGGI